MIWIRLYYDNLYFLDIIDYKYVRNDFKKGKNWFVYIGLK